MKHLIKLCFLLPFLSLAQDKEDKELVFPDRWFLNSSKKKALELNYSYFNFDSKHTDFYTFKNTPAFSLGYQHFYRLTNHSKIIRDDIIRFAYFLPEHQIKGLETWERKGWQLSGTGGWDLFGWKFLDLTPTYGWAFGNRKFFVSDQTNSLKKIKNPFIGVCLGLDMKFNIYIKKHGFAIGAYGNYTFDVTRSTWKNKDSYSGIIPESDRFNNLQVGFSLQYIVLNRN